MVSSIKMFAFRVSERQISIYKATDLSAPINTVGLDVSPAILMPYYDEDSSTLFVTGKVRLTKIIENFSGRLI